MSLLRPQLRQQLRERLLEALSSTTVTHGNLISSDALYRLDDALPKSGEVRDRLEGMVGEHPLYTFAISRISEQLEFSWDNGKTIPLSETEEFSDVISTSQQLIDEFASLPWQYVISIPLPASFSDEFRRHYSIFDLSDDARLITGKRLSADGWTFATEGQRRTGDGRDVLISEDRNVTIVSDHTYLQVSVHGFINKWSTTEPIYEAMGRFRAVCGLLMASGALNWLSFVRTPRQSSFVIVHRSENASREFLQTYRLDAKYIDTLDHLSFAANDPHQKLILDSSLTRILTALRQPKHAQRVLLAAQWHLDSHCGGDEILQFVQATTVIEILLGDDKTPKDVGLTELLKNRCAFHIAQSPSDREEILTLFPKIYAVRSRIVHAGKPRLSSEDRLLFERLRWLCRRTINAEIDLIAKEPQLIEPDK